MLVVPVAEFSHSWYKNERTLTGRIQAKVLIIGGTGLISTATTRVLLARGVEITHYTTVE